LAVIKIKQYAAAHFFKQRIARHIILIGTLYAKCITKQYIQNLNHD